MTNEYIIAAVFIILIGVNSYFIDKMHKEEDESYRIYLAYILLAVLIVSGGSFSYKAFYLDPKLKKEVLQSFLQMDQ